MLWAKERGRRIVVVDRGGGDPPGSGPLAFLALIEVLRWVEPSTPPVGLREAVMREPARLRDLATLDHEALEWHHGGRTRDSLRRGQPLVVADALVATASERPPEADESATPVTLDFLAASRAARSSRRRGWTVGVVLALAIAIAASGLVVVSRTAATGAAEERSAEEWRRQAADPDLTDPAATLRLQLDAYALHPTREARAALARGLHGGHLRRTLSDRAGSIRSVAYTADGGGLMTGSSDSSLRIYGDADVAARAT